MSIKDKLIQNYKNMVKNANKIIWDDKLIKLDFKYKKEEMLKDDVVEMLKDITVWEQELKRYMNNLKGYVKHELEL